MHFFLCFFFFLLWLNTASSLVIQNLVTEEIVLRRATLDDIPSLQNCNRATLPENYPNKFYKHHIEKFPDLTVVAELRQRRRCDNDSIQPIKIVGYALSCIQERLYIEDSPPLYEFSRDQHQKLEAFHMGKDSCPQVTYGHVISLAVSPMYRRMGLASMLMHRLHGNMKNNYHAVVSDLSVRVSNEAAIRLYEREGYEICKMLSNYYTSGNGEDGYTMEKDLSTVLGTSDSSIVIRVPQS